MKKERPIKTEYFLPVEGYYGLYEVSNYGRIRNSRGRIMHPEKNKRNGYLQLCLKKDGVTKMHYVHRLVANTFLPNMFELESVNHIDEDRTNNCVWNLEWVTIKENNNHGNRNKKLSKSLKNNPNKKKSVLQYTMDGELVCEWSSLSEIRRVLGYKYVFLCCSGKYKSYKGYIWKYKDS